MTNSELVTLFESQAKAYSSNIFPTTLVREWLDEGQIDLVRRSECLVGNTTVNLTANTREYNLATDILRLKHIYYTDGTNYYRLHRSSLDELETYGDFPGETAGDPTHYYISMAATPVIGLYPTPDSTVSNGLKYWYVKRPTDLTTAANDPNIPEPYHRVIVLYALWRSLQKDVKNETADRYFQLYEREAEKMVHDMRNWDGKRRLRMRPYNTDQRDRYPAYDFDR